MELAQGEAEELRDRGRMEWNWIKSKDEIQAARLIVSTHLLQVSVCWSFPCSSSLLVDHAPLNNSIRIRLNVSNQSGAWKRVTVRGWQHACDAIWYCCLYSTYILPRVYVFLLLAQSLLLLLVSPTHSTQLYSTLVYSAVGREDKQRLRHETPSEDATTPTHNTTHR